MKQVCIQRARKSVCDRPDLLDLHDVVVKLMNRIRLNPNSTPAPAVPANLSSLICPSNRARGVQFWVQSDRRSQTTSVNLFEKTGSSGWTRTSNPPVNSRKKKR